MQGHEGGALASKCSLKVVSKRTIQEMEVRRQQKKIKEICACKIIIGIPIRSVAMQARKSYLVVLMILPIFARKQWLCSGTVTKTAVMDMYTFTFVSHASEIRMQSETKQLVS
jgi:hypothetical protein